MSLAHDERPGQPLKIGVRLPQPPADRARAGPTAAGPASSAAGLPASSDEARRSPAGAPPARLPLRRARLSSTFMSPRRVWSAFVLSLMGVAAIVVLAPLFLITYYVARMGASSLSVAFFTRLPQPVGVVEAGMANAIAGTIELLAIALLIGVPLGIAAGAYVGEFGKESFSTGVRFAADVLNGLPTIVTGMFVYALLVVPMRRFSALAGGIALAIILLPVVIRSAEEVLRTVPNAYREAALALGATHRQMVWSVVLRAARPGLVTVVLLGIGRIAGETAPLLFTSFNNSFWSFRPDQPIAALTVQLFNYAISPYDEWHAQAWAGALVLLALVLVISAVARLWARQTYEARN